MKISNSMSIKVFYTVPDLPVCVTQRGGPQCCSTQFILEQLNITLERFLDGLRIELQERFQAFDTIADGLRACKSTILFSSPLLCGC